MSWDEEWEKAEIDALKKKFKALAPVLKEVLEEMEVKKGRVREEQIPPIPPQIIKPRRKEIKFVDEEKEVNKLLEEGWEIYTIIPETAIPLQTWHSVSKSQRCWRISSTSAVS